MSVAFLHANNEAAERESKKTISFTITPKIVRYLGINVTKEVKDLYSENYKTLRKKIEDDTKKQKDIACLWIGRTNIVKMSVIPDLHLCFVLFCFVLFCFVFREQVGVGERGRGRENLKQSPCSAWSTT